MVVALAASVRVTVPEPGEAIVAEGNVAVTPAGRLLAARVTTELRPEMTVMVSLVD